MGSRAQFAHVGSRTWWRRPDCTERGPVTSLLAALFPFAAVLLSVVVLSAGLDEEER